MLVDSHCHLNMAQFADNLDEVIARARKSKIERIQTICVKLEDLPVLLQITEKYEDIYCSVGIHPHEVEKAEIITAEKLIALAKSHPKIIGIGETGLDYYYEYSKPDIQKQSFLCHIQAARETGKPLIVHSRSADEDILEILKSEMQKGSYKCLIHCFTASKKFAEECLEMGCYISIAGIITFGNAEDLRSTVRDIPLDRLLIETDSPYLAPIPHRGKTCEPAFVEFVARKIAEIKGISFEEVARITTENFYRLFF
jgi:TatD DNase family protein